MSSSWSLWISRRVTAKHCVSVGLSYEPNIDQFYEAETSAEVLHGTLLTNLFLLVGCSMAGCLGVLASGSAMVLDGRVEAKDCKGTNCGTVGNLARSDSLTSKKKTTYLTCTNN